MASLTTTERKIEYYKITADGGDKGLLGYKLTGIMKHVTAEDREYDYHDTKVNLELMSAKKNDDYIRGTVQQLRFVAPSVREIGHTDSKPVDLKETEGIDEKTHFIYCPDTSLLCIEYNYHGPKVGLLVNVINGIYKSKIDPKERRSTYKFIQEGGAVRKVIESAEIRTVIAKPVDPMTTGKMNEDADLPSAIKEFNPPVDASMEFKLTPKVKGHGLMSGSAFKKSFLRSSDDLEYYDKLQVSAVDDSTGKIVPYDLIKDKLNEKFTIELIPGTKAINSEYLMSIMDKRIVAIKQEYILS